MVIDVKNLVKRYDRLVALDYLDLTVEQGEIYGLLGPGGSGKSTLLHCLVSLLPYDKGSICIFDKPMSPEAYDIKKDIGIVFQNIAVFKELSLYENISYFCSLYMENKQEVKNLTKEVISFMGLDDFVKFHPNKLSTGLLKRLNFACGIVHKPKLIILDEPITGADPQSRKKIIEGIKKLNDDGTTIVYASLNMEEIEQLCTKISMIDKGKVIAKGSKDELKNMITLGEKITVEAFQISSEQLTEITKLPNIVSVDYDNSKLMIKSKKGKNNLIQILDYLQANEVIFGRIYTEIPTLDDVFLEFTGKGIRD